MRRRRRGFGPSRSLTAVHSRPRTSERRRPQAKLEVDCRLERRVSADQVDAGVFQAVQLLERGASLRTRLDYLGPALAFAATIEAEIDGNQEATIWTHGDESFAAPAADPARWRGQASHCEPPSLLRLPCWALVPAPPRALFVYPSRAASEPCVGSSRSSADKPLSARDAVGLDKASCPSFAQEGGRRDFEAFSTFSAAFRGNR
jgi:hypothetical protein